MSEQRRKAQPSAHSESASEASEAHDGHVRDYVQHGGQ